MELLKVKTIKEMKKIICSEFKSLTLKTEKISIHQGLDRVLSKEIISERDVPHFDRSVVDGYAVKLSDVQAASQGIPGFLKIVGEVEMGKETTLQLKQGEAVYVPTGGMLPQGSEAMIMIEYSERFGDFDLAIYKNAGADENIMRIGDDIKKNEIVFKKGHLLRPQDLGVLSALGFLDIFVFSLPKISIISTGDEIIALGEIPKLGEVIDINTLALEGVTRKQGAEVCFTTKAKDDFDSLQETVKKALAISDIVVISGGSSVGEKDYTLKVIKSLGEVFVHGLAVKPGKPTILGKAQKKPIIGLPGQPASAIMVYMQVLQEFLRVFYGETFLKEGSLQGKLMENVHASPGRRTFQTVSIKQDQDETKVYPTHGKSGMITLLSASDGYIEMTENEEGKNVGDWVKVSLF